MKKRKSILICLILSLALCVGCSKEPEQSNEPGLLLGFSQIGSESAWRIGNTRDIEEAAEKKGINLKLENANQKQENQIAAIRRFIAYQVDVIAFSPIVEDGWDNVLEEAKSAGIPVILVDRDISTEKEDLTACLIGADFYKEGYMAGEYLIRKADSLNLEHVNIVEITGTVNSTPMRQRQAGFMDAIASDTRMNIMESIDGDFLKSRGEENMRYLLDKYGGDIDAVFSHNDEMTLGALPEIEKAGFIPGKDMIIISIDGGQDAINVLKEGKINCVVECTPKLGGLLMDTALKLKSGEAVKDIIHPEEQVFSDEQDTSKIEPRGY
ncbi:MAG: ABC transporter substrate-binding protein [Lachnospiraceae bacterium]|nr:ABC transporter substrate-binding protein [Lachnospiraceae bacterium]MBR3581575.1 ABC transporter substrate-binding protein [Lachnospiraceae bacterium]